MATLRIDTFASSQAKIHLRRWFWSGSFEHRSCVNEHNALKTEASFNLISL